MKNGMIQPINANRLKLKFTKRKELDRQNIKNPVVRYQQHKVNIVECWSYSKESILFVEVGAYVSRTSKSFSTCSTTVKVSDI